jgi:hypothetical protein
MPNLSPSHELDPVSREATEAAFDRIIGGPVTNRARYDSYIHRVSVRQGGFWGAVQLLGDAHERARRIVAADIPLQAHSYIGGALIYLASREQQAKLDDRPPLPELLVGEVGRTALGDLMLGGVPLEQLDDLVNGFSRQMSQVNLDQVASADLRDALTINDRIFRAYHAAFEASPEADDLTATIADIARVMEMSTAMRVVAFPEQEPAFCEVMTERWWHDMPTPVILGQMTGAADARELIAMSM